MADENPLGFDISELDEDERDRLLSELAAEDDIDVAILRDLDPDAVRQVIGEDVEDLDAPSKSLPGFAGPVEPELLLVVLESTLILIEGSKIAHVSKKKAEQFLKDRGHEGREMNQEEIDSLI